VTDPAASSLPDRWLSDNVVACEFFQAVRILRLLDGRRAPVGHVAHPLQELVRFRSHVSFRFPASDVHEVREASDDDRPHEMVVNFMGVISPQSRGSLPSFYARIALDEARDGNPAVRDFYDLFNHRFVTFFLRAFEKHNFPIQYEAFRQGSLQQVLYSLIGLGTPHLRERCSIDSRALLRMAGTLARRPVTAGGLADLIATYFGLPVEVLQFVEACYALEPEQQLCLGATGRVGIDTALGAFVTTAQSKFRLRIGPLDYDRFAELLPTGGMFRPLTEQVRLAVGPEFDFDLQLVLRADAVPRLQLDPRKEHTMRLGWSTWLDARRDPDDADDAICPASDLERL
jgi:type VI secretion system protein ImpH